MKKLFYVLYLIFCIALFAILQKLDRDGPTRAFMSLMLMIAAISNAIYVRKHKDSSEEKGY